MEDTKITQMAAASSLAATDLVPVVVDPGGSPANRKATLLQLQSVNIGGMVPVGAIVAWHKTLTGCPALPSNFVQCDGQTLSDAESPFNGQTIPNLNGGNLYLRGNSTSGTEGGDSSPQVTGQTFYTDMVDDDGGGTEAEVLTGIDGPGSVACESPYMDVVWIMRIK